MDSILVAAWIVIAVAVVWVWRREQCKREALNLWLALEKLQWDGREKFVTDLEKVPLRSNLVLSVDGKPAKKVLVKWVLWAKREADKRREEK